MQGSAVRMEADALREELGRGGALQNVLQAYAHALFIQVTQSAGCVSTHAVDKRLSRWLVMTHDHAPGDEFEMKHEFMAMMLGATRSVVTRAVAEEGDRVGCRSGHAGRLNVSVVICGSHLRARLILEKRQAEVTHEV